MTNKELNNENKNKNNTWRNSPKIINRIPIDKDKTTKKIIFNMIHPPYNTGRIVHRILTWSYQISQLPR